MTLGTGTYVPGGQFAFPRSYVRAVGFHWDRIVYTNTSNPFEGYDPLFPDVSVRVRFADEFWSWSSNAYTLDFLIVESWYKTSPGGSENPMPFLLEFWNAGQDEAPIIYFTAFGAASGSLDAFVLPPAPPGYWRPAWM